MDKNTQDAFLWICDIFAKADVDFVVSGGLAAKMYGSPRSLYDIDIDLRDEDFQKVAKILNSSHFAQYVVYGPARYTDEKWDIWLLTLNYKDQYIDVCGSSSAKIYSYKKNVWIAYPFDLKTSVPVKIFERNIKFISKELLLQYKSILNREEDSEDIKNLSSHL